MVTHTDYTAEAVAAARAVLLELAHLLGAFHNDIVVVGGWVPELLLPEGAHIGSTDVDIAVNHRTLEEPHYKRFQELLLSRGYRQAESQPFIFYRAVPTADGRQIQVEVDLLAGEYAGTGPRHRTQKFDDVLARKARGSDLAFELFTEVELQGELPGGGKDQAHIRVASIVPFLVMKGMALADRMKEKDAWDIYFCLQHYPGGIDALAQAFEPHLAHGLVREGLDKIAQKFASPEHVGPKFVADFEAPTDPEARARLQRDAFERVSRLLEKLRRPPTKL